METVTSKDGTIIAYDKSGSGPVVILVDGALQYRAFDQGMAELQVLLSKHFTVIHYDRRGRGDSTDTQPFAVAREIEDIEALIDKAGGSAYLYGISSGAALAFEAALALDGKVKKLALYEAPYNDDQDYAQRWKQYRKELDKILATDRHGDALALFMMLVGASADDVNGIRQDPMWGLWEAVERTLPYDAAALGEDSSVPTEKAARLAVPTLVMNGGNSFPFMHETAVKLAKAMPNGQHRTLEGQTHEVASEAIAPVLVEFFKA
jgi:pimeloyl-ACP methyl ester carboxylesterase